MPPFILAPQAEAIHIQIDDRRRVKRQHLAHDQAADNRDTQRRPQFGTIARAQRQWYGAQHGGHGEHHYRPETQAAGFENGVARRQSLLALYVQGEVDHDDRVLLDDTDQQDHADQSDQAEIGAGCQQGAHAGGLQGRDDGDRMDITFIQHAEHDAVPWKLPCTEVSTTIHAIASLIAEVAADSETPCGRLYKMVEAMN